MEHLIRIGGRGVFRYLMPWGATLCLALGVAASAAASGSHYYDWWKPKPRVLASGLIGATGATTGPDGALYVAQSSLGEIRRVDPRTGRKRLIASGLPSTDQTIGLGGLMDVEFIGKDMYALVTLQVDGVTTNGIYKRIGWNDFQPIADLGTFSAQNQPPPGFQVDVPIGVQFAMEPIDQGFLVSDGHHNRILHVAIDGLDSEISVLKQFGNTVPTGLAGQFGTTYVAMLGSVDFYPADAGVTAFGLLQPDNAREVASGVPMIVDVEFGPDGELYAISQGELGSLVPGAPALEKTGKLLKVKPDGSFRVLARNLDRPTSLNFVCGDAHVVTLAGQVLQFKSLAGFALRIGGRCF